MSASRMSECEFSREKGGWCCIGDGNLLGEETFGHGTTKQAAYADYLRTRKRELAGMIEDDAEEAEFVQEEIRQEGGDPDNHGTSLRDGLMADADTEAMRERARRLREEAGDFG